MWEGSHTHGESTLRTSLVYLCHWVCLLALPWNHSSNDHVLPFWFRVSSSGWPQHQSFIFKARIKGHQLYWKDSVSFSHRSSQRGIRYLSEAEPDNVFPPAPVSPPLRDPTRSRIQSADAFCPRPLEHMIWWVLSIMCFRSILCARSDLASPVGFTARRLPVMI